MNMSRNFTKLVPGKYQDARKRIVVIQGPPEIVPQRQADLSILELEKWTGTVYKADGKTAEGIQHYTAEGCEWGNRSNASERDLEKVFEKFEVAA